MKQKHADETGMKTKPKAIAPYSHPEKTFRPWKGASPAKSVELLPIPADITGFVVREENINALEGALRAMKPFPSPPPAAANWAPAAFYSETVPAIIAWGREAMKGVLGARARQANVALPADRSPYRTNPESPQMIARAAASSGLLDDGIFLYLSKAATPDAGAFLASIALDAEAYGMEVREKALSALIARKGSCPRSLGMLYSMGYADKLPMKDYRPWSLHWAPPASSGKGAIAGFCSGTFIAAMLSATSLGQGVLLMMPAIGGVIGMSFGTLLRTINRISSVFRWAADRDALHSRRHGLGIDAIDERIRQSEPGASALMKRLPPAQGEDAFPSGGKMEPLKR
ncbi:hypothetical protein L0Y65_02410 [Candidatus Micrarchaeota archaeon]|nr:hypothetical protein [Candidatus Micrarchaeota archaeon]